MLYNMWLNGLLMITWISQQIEVCLGHSEIQGQKPPGDLAHTHRGSSQTGSLPALPPYPYHPRGPVHSYYAPWGRQKSRVVWPRPHNPTSEYRLTFQGYEPHTRLWPNWQDEHGRRPHWVKSGQLPITQTGPGGSKASSSSGNHLQNPEGNIGSKNPWSVRKFPRRSATGAIHVHPGQHIVGSTAPREVVNLFQGELPKLQNPDDPSGLVGSLKQSASFQSEIPNGYTDKYSSQTTFASPNTVIQTGVSVPQMLSGPPVSDPARNPPPPRNVARVDNKELPRLPWRPEFPFWADHMPAFTRYPNPERTSHYQAHWGG